jgi:hypothetical protein
MSNVNVVQKQAGIILSDGNNKDLSFLCVFMTSVRELNCHTVYMEYNSRNIRIKFKSNEEEAINDCLYQC